LYNRPVRKARGADAALLIILCAATAPFCAQADSARDGHVNPGNSEHLGTVEVRQEVAEPLDEDAERPSEGEPAEELDADAALGSADGASATSGWGEAETCTSCGGCRDCCGCRKGCGTLEFFGPLAIVNVHPPNQLFFSPLPDKATVLADGLSSFDLRIDSTSVILRELDSGIVTDYDYEELRATGDWQQRWGKGQFGARLPVTYRSHGTLDGIISSWHKWLGLPNGLRNRFPDNGYRYTIISRDGLVFNDEGDTLGIGDLALSYKYPLWNRGEGKDALSLRAGAKLPLGDPDQALGSGNFDYSLGLLWQRQLSPHWRGYVNFDYVFIGEPDWKNIGWQSGPVSLWALEHALSHNTTVVAQYRTHVNYLRVGSFEADKDAQELAIGFNNRVSDRLVWSGGFNEDLNPETSPDFVMMSYLKWEF